MRGFGDLEALIMDRLWNAASARTVRDVQAELTSERRLAYTTVMTVMDKLHRKGWLSRYQVGRAYAYQPVMSRERYTAELMGEALASSSDRSATLSAFVDGLDPVDAQELRAVLERYPPARGYRSPPEQPSQRPS
jgi:predicted transcriptional regulator